MALPVICFLYAAMCRPFGASFILLICVSLLSGCDSKPWSNASKFEQQLTCATSLEEVKKVAEEFKMRIKEIPGNAVALFLFKGNTAYSMGFRDGGLLFLQKQGFRTWLAGGLKETISVESVLRCS
mgnify:FL=1|tara:strand:- start:45 stop:422 length:378 start_codon:yes stop_codon:yes gene_type:complete